MNSELLITKYRNKKSVTTKEILALGYNKHNIEKMRREGIIARQKRGIYKVVENRNYNDLMFEVRRLEKNHNYEEAIIYAQEACKLQTNIKADLSILADLIILERYEEASTCVHKILKTYLNGGKILLYYKNSFNILVNILNYFYPLHSSILQQIPPKTEEFSKKDAGTLYYIAAVDHLENNSLAIAQKNIEKSLAQIPYKFRTRAFMTQTLNVLIPKIFNKQQEQEGFTFEGVIKLKKLSAQIREQILNLVTSNKYEEAKKLLEKKMDIDRRSCQINQIYNKNILILLTEIQNLQRNGQSSYKNSKITFSNTSTTDFKLERYIRLHDFQNAYKVACHYKCNLLIKTLLKKIDNYNVALREMASKDDIINESIEKIIRNKKKYKNYNITKKMDYYLASKKLSLFDYHIACLNIAKRLYIARCFELGDLYYYKAMPGEFKSPKLYQGVARYKEKIKLVRDYIQEQQKKHQ